MMDNDGFIPNEVDLRKIDTLLKKLEENENKTYDRNYYLENRERILAYQKEYRKRKKSQDFEQRVVQEERRLLDANLETPAMKKKNKSKMKIYSAIKRGEQVRNGLTCPDDTIEVRTFVDFQDLYYDIEEFFRFLLVSGVFDCSVIREIYSNIKNLYDFYEKYVDRGVIPYGKWKTVIEQYTYGYQLWSTYLSTTFNHDFLLASNQLSVNCSRKKACFFEELVKRHVGFINCDFKQINDILSAMSIS